MFTMKKKLNQKERSLFGKNFFKGRMKQYNDRAVNLMKGRGRVQQAMLEFFTSGIIMFAWMAPLSIVRVPWIDFMNASIPITAIWISAFGSLGVMLGHVVGAYVSPTGLVMGVRTNTMKSSTAWTLAMGQFAGAFAFCMIALAISEGTGNLEAAEANILITNGSATSSMKGPLWFRPNLPDHVFSNHGTSMYYFDFSNLSGWYLLQAIVNMAVIIGSALVFVLINKIIKSGNYVGILSLRFVTGSIIIWAAIQFGGAHMGSPWRVFAPAFAIKSVNANINLTPTFTMGAANILITLTLPVVVKWITGLSLKENPISKVYGPNYKPGEEHQDSIFIKNK